tara:strand:- start:174 stop:1712 length:1539 start_codon:yes stop_codon:yes gene_type:complete
MKSLKHNNKSINDQIAFSKHTIECDPFDIEFFEEIKDKNTKITKTADEGTKEYDQFPELHQDLFSALFRYKPELMDPKKIDKNFLLNREIMDQLMETDRYKELRNLTQLDKVNSTVATEVLGKQVFDILKDLKEQREAQQAVSDAMNEAAKAAKKEAGEGAGDDGDGESAEAEEHITLKEAQERLKEAENNLEDSLKKREIKSKFSNALDEAIGTTQQTSEMITNWGLDNDNSFSRKPYHEKMSLLNKLKNSPKLLEIAKLAGRFRNLAVRKEKEKVKVGFHEVYDISRGDNITRALPSEYMKLAKPALKLQFLKELADKSILQYEINGKSEKGKGAIVMCLDSSGSMSGEPEIWAKSVALALLEVSIIQKRNFFCIHFDSANDLRHLHTNKFLKPDNYSIDEVVDMAEYFAGGGTLFHPALKLAKKQIQLDTEFSKADIIFVTDGQSAITDEFANEFNTWRKKNNVNVYSILIDSWHNSDSALKLFSDKITKLNSIKMKGEAIAVSIFENL